MVCILFYYNCYNAFIAISFRLILHFFRIFNFASLGLKAEYQHPPKNLRDISHKNSPAQVNRDSARTQSVEERSGPRHSLAHEMVHGDKNDNFDMENVRRRDELIRFLQSSLRGRQDRASLRVELEHERAALIQDAMLSAMHMQMLQTERVEQRSDKELHGEQALLREHVIQGAEAQFDEEAIAHSESNRRTNAAETEARKRDEEHRQEELAKSKDQHGNHGSEQIDNERLNLEAETLPTQAALQVQAQKIVIKFNSFVIRLKLFIIRFKLCIFVHIVYMADLYILSGFYIICRYFLNLYLYIIYLLNGVCIARRTLFFLNCMIRLNDPLD